MTKLRIPVARVSFCIQRYQAYTRTRHISASPIDEIESTESRGVGRSEKTYSPKALGDVQLDIVLGHFVVHTEEGRLRLV